MTLNCTHCNSEDVSPRGSRGASRRYFCNVCRKWFSKQVETEYIPTINTTKRYVVTACQNNATINTEFLKTLVSYCSLNYGELLIAPILYRPDDYDVITYNIPEDTPYTMVTKKMAIHPEVFVMGSFSFIPTAVNPLSGLESLSKGDTLIVPSPQLRMKSLAVSASRHPAILHTTGAISNPEYTNTKVGEKAKFNHSYSAVLIEIDSDGDFHIRVLNGDDSGAFTDLGKHYTPNGAVTEDLPLALVTGDEHAVVADPEVERATYTGPASIVRTLKPKYVVRHDILDCSSISHHDRHNTIKNIGKQLFGNNSIVRELETTVAYLERTSLIPGTDFTNIIVASNHVDHIVRWFSEVDIRTEPHNALFYHTYMAKIIKSMTHTPTGVQHVHPFEAYCADVGVKYTRFLRRDESFKIGDVELGHHGDKGTNGSRGSINQFANLCDKTVIGHSHSPGIVFGAYQVGTSSYKKLDYTSGMSSWMNSHCIVYASGKRQLINIINGKWRA